MQAVLVLVLAALALSVSCNDAGPEPQSPPTTPPSATGTPGASGSITTPTPAGWQIPLAPITPAFRTFAARIEQALQGGNLEFFRSRALTREIVCTAENTPPRFAGGPSCERVGQTFDGFPIAAWRSEGTIVPLENALRTLARMWTEVVPGSSDSYGGSAPDVYAIGTGPSADASSYTSLLTSIIQRPPEFGTGGPLRTVMLLTWTDSGTEYELTGILTAFVLGEEFLDRDPITIGWMPVWERFTP